MQWTSSLVISKRSSMASSYVNFTVWTVLKCGNQSCLLFVESFGGTAHLVCGAGSMKLLGVRLSVCPSSNHPHAAAVVCCCGPGRQEISIDCYTVWRRGMVVSGICRMNGANPRRARLVLGWVTVFGWYTISVCNQPSWSTQPCIPPGLLNRIPASTGVRAGMWRHTVWSHMAREFP